MCGRVHGIAKLEVLTLSSYHVVRQLAAFAAAIIEEDEQEASNFDFSAVAAGKRAGRRGKTEMERFSRDFLFLAKPSYSNCL